MFLWAGVVAPSFVVYETISKSISLQNILEHFWVMTKGKSFNGKQLQQYSVKDTLDSNMFSSTSIEFQEVQNDSHQDHTQHVLQELVPKYFGISPKSMYPSCHRRWRPKAWIACEKCFSVSKEAWRLQRQ